MKTPRAALALLLCFAVPVRAETTTDPLWTLLSSYVLTPDEKAAEIGGENGDAKGLAALQADLRLLADGFESFRDEAQVKESLVKLGPRMSPELRPFFQDRRASLEAVYRTLAVTDYTWAKRFPEPPCGPEERRSVLLSARDGLFSDAQGEASPWLVALLGDAVKGKSAGQALDQAGSKTPLAPAAYERLRAKARAITLALASERAEGAVRAKLYCDRAEVYEDLAAAHARRNEGPIEAGLTARPSANLSVFVVVWKGRRAAAIMLRAKSGPMLVTDADIVSGTDEPHIFAWTGSDPVELKARVVRRHHALGLAELRLDDGVQRPGLALAETAPEKGELVTTVGHTQLSGLWSKTSGLVVKTDGLSFQTDAALSPELSGAPVFDEGGKVAGLLVLRPADTEEGRWPIAVSAPLLARWMDGEDVPAQPTETAAIEDSGTAAILSYAKPAPIETGLGAWTIPSLPPPPPTPRGVCVSGCNSPSAPSRSYSDYSGGSSYSSGSAGAEIGKALAPLVEALIFRGIPALFRGIGKLIKGKGGSSSHTSQVAQTPPAPKAVQAPPPPKIEGLELTLTPDELIEGESLEAIAKLRFSGTNPKKGGIDVSFEYNGKTHTATTGPNGVAVFTIPIEPRERSLRDRPFDSLKDEELRARGEGTPTYLKPHQKNPTAVDKVTRRSSSAFAALDNEEGTQRGLEDGALDNVEGVDVDAVAAEWADDKEGLIQAASALPAAPMNLPDIVPLEKLYDLPVLAKVSAGSMGSASDSKPAAVMSNRCPPGTAAPDQDPPNGSPGQPPLAPPDKATLDKVCREYEQAADEACATTGTKACKDTVLMLLEYDFRSCVNRWEPDGSGSAGGIGSPVPPTPRRLPPSRRCVRIESAKTGSIAGTNSHARTLGKGTQRPMGDAVRASWRALIKRLLGGARFLKNVTHAIFEVQGGLAKLTELFDAVTQGHSVDKRPDGIKTAKMPDGTTIALRPSSSGGPPTIQINGPGGQKVKVRAP